MTFEARARQAATTMEEAVVTVSPSAGLRRIRRKRRIRQARQLMVAGVAIVGLIVGAAWLQTAPEIQEQPPAATQPQIRVEAPPEPPTVTVRPERRADSVLPEDARLTESMPPLEEADAIPAPSPDTNPPTLMITSPADGQVFEVDHVLFEGTTEPGAKISTGIYEADVDADGNWYMVLVLEPGTNAAELTATDASGNTTTTQIFVQFDPAGVATATPLSDNPGDSHDTSSSHDSVDQGSSRSGDHGGDESPPQFVAYQAYGRTGKRIAYEVYIGTAVPGATVTASSPYGSRSDVADDAGRWHIKMVFPSAPYGEPFDVTLSDGLGNTAVFTFTSNRRG